MKKQLKQSGFTLFEILIVIGIIGIVMAISVPNISSTLLRYHARTEARELVIQFKKAKLEAVKRNRDVCIDFKNVGTINSRYEIFVNVDRDVNTPHTFDQALGDIMLVDRQLRANVQLLSTNFANNQTGYNPRGLPLEMGTIVLGTGTAGLRSYKLSVSLTGNVGVK